MHDVDDLRVGSLVRAVRHRLGWTQAEVATRAGVSQKLVSLLETGQLERFTVASARRIGSVLEVRLPFAPIWRGGDGARLLDSDHALLVEAVLRLLQRTGWGTLVEYSFNVYGERGAVDVIGWHAASRTLLIVEVKPRLLDNQETLSTLGRKVRLVPGQLARERGWAASAVGVALVLSDLTSNRVLVRRHAATFDSALPARNRELRRWLAGPVGAVAGVWFLSPSNGMTGTRHTGARKRVRIASARSAGVAGPAPQ